MSGRSGRTRRTRVYDCNFDMGAQYYKSALDSIDQKNAAPKVSTETLETRPKFNVDNILNDDLSAARRRAEKAITEDTVLDTRSGRFFRSDKEDEFDDEVQASLNRIRAIKKTANLSSNHDLEDTITTVKRRAHLDFGSEKNDSEVSSANMRARALKIVSNAENFNGDASSLTKWTAVDANSINSAAAQRAKATKLRLDDIESEMYERSEKQAAREKRAVNLRKMMADNDIETSSYKMVSSTKTEKHVSF